MAAVVSSVFMKIAACAKYPPQYKLSQTKVSAAGETRAGATARKLHPESDGWVELHHVDYSFHTGAGGRHHAPVAIVKDQGVMSTFFPAMAFANDMFDVTIEFMNPATPDSATPIVTMKLLRAQVASYSLAGNDDGATESVTFKYDEVDFKDAANVVANDATGGSKV